MTQTSARNKWECDYCGQVSPSGGLRLCPTCERVEREARGDLAQEAMYPAAIRLIEGRHLQRVFDLQERRNVDAEASRLLVEVWPGLLHTLRSECGPEDHALLRDIGIANLAIRWLTGPEGRW